MSSSGVQCLSTNPDAPSRSARSTFGSVPKDVSMTARTDGACLRSSPSAPRPSRTGMVMSSSATSGRCRTAAATAALPSVAVATTSMSPADSSTVRMPAVISGSSSATSTRTT